MGEAWDACCRRHPFSSQLLGSSPTTFQTYARYHSIRLGCCFSVHRETLSYVDWHASQISPTGCPSAIGRLFFLSLPIAPRSPAHMVPPLFPPTAGNSSAHTISHLMYTDRTDSLPPDLPPATVDRSHHRFRRLPIGLLRHTPYRPCRRAGLPTGCLSIPPHSMLSSCLSPAAAVPSSTQRHEAVATARETWAR